MTYKAFLIFYPFCTAPTPTPQKNHPKQNKTKKAWSGLTSTGIVYSIQYFYCIQHYTMLIANTKYKYIYTYIHLVANTLNKFFIVYFSKELIQFN